VIVVDTNVISELMRGEPNPVVLAWVALQPEHCHTRHISTKPRSFMASLPCPKVDGRPRWGQGLQRCSDEDFADRILPFDAGAAAHYPEIVLARRRAGNPIEKFDALIAATALAAGASIATRDTGGFGGCGLTLVNPWEAT
jgi:toxin FitB